MKKSLQAIGLVSALALLSPLSVPAATTTSTYKGNGKSDFDGAIGNGMLTFSSDGTTLTGTITNGNASAGFNDTLVIYIDSVTGGFTSTSTFMDTGGGTDNLRSAISGYNGTTRALLNFATGFGADYAIAIGPSSASFGAVFTLSSATGFTYGSDGSNGNVNITPNNTGTSATYTFSLPLSVIGSPTSFRFSTTYLNGGTATGTSAYRSNETFGNTLTDATNPANTGSVGQDTAAAGFLTFPVPEPGTWAMMAFAGFGFLIVCRRRARRA